MSVLAPRPHPPGPSAVYLRTLCFLFHGEELLLIHRRRPPDAGYWNAVGGKIDRGEDPLEAARREVREETGLDVPLAFRGVATVVVRATGEHWLIFLFTGAAPTPEVRESPEGPLRWVRPDAVAHLPVLPLLLPHVRDAGGRVLLAKFTYAAPDPATLESAEIR